MTITLQGATKYPTWQRLRTRNKLWIKRKKRHNSPSRGNHSACESYCENYNSKYHVLIAPCVHQPMKTLPVDV